MIDHPQTLAVFRELGIDCSCGGKSLEYARGEQGHDVNVVRFVVSSDEHVVRGAKPAAEERGWPRTSR